MLSTEQLMNVSITIGENEAEIPGQGLPTLITIRFTNTGYKATTKDATKIVLLQGKRLHYDDTQTTQ